MLFVYKAKTVGPICRRIAKNIDAKRYNQAIAVRECDYQYAEPHDILVRWGSTVRADLHTVINTAEAVANARDKIKTRNLLGPLSPETWTQRQAIEVPCVIRPSKHFGGHKFFVCRTSKQVDYAIRRCGLNGSEWYASRLIYKREEFRVFILHGSIICVSDRTHPDPDAIAWNLAKGGSLKNLRREYWEPEVLTASTTAMQDLGLDWGAVDVAIGEDGEACVFEVNTAPGLTNPYTIKQIVKAFAWTQRHSDNISPYLGEGWQLHPALKLGVGN